MTEKKKKETKGDPPVLSEEDLDGMQGGADAATVSPLHKVREAASSDLGKQPKHRTKWGAT